MLMKLGKVDYVYDTTTDDNFDGGIATGGQGKYVTCHIFCVFCYYIDKYYYDYCCC